MSRCLSLVLVLLALTAATAQGIVFTQSPRDRELFSRDQRDSAEVVFAGSVTSAGHDSVRLEIDRNGAFFSRSRAVLVYQDGTASFHLTGRLHAELSEFRAHFFLDDSLACLNDSLLCGDVLLINGQSNALGGTCAGGNEWLRSFGTSSPTPEACLADTSWCRATARTYYDHGSIGDWGLILGLALVNAYHVPVAILNGAVGGTQIISHQRNDGDPTDLSSIYGRLLWRCEKAGVQARIRAILWHQGESDSYVDPMTYYVSLFTSLDLAWHQDYGGLEKVYVFQIHPGCGGDYQAQMREIQRTLPGLFPDLEVMSTLGLATHDGCHYGIGGYYQMGHWILGLVARDLYGSQDTVHIAPPNVATALFSPAHDEVQIRFDDEIRWPADTLGARMKDYFYVDGQGESGHITSGRVLQDGRTVSLLLDPPAWSANRVTYLPGCCYTNGGGFYEGPWIRNPRGIGALSFWEFPIDEPSGVAESPAQDRLRLMGNTPNPFSRETAIHFFIGSPRRVRILLFDASGRLIRTLFDGPLPAGEQSIRWDGTDGSGRRTPSGRYWYGILGADGARRGRMLILR